MIDEATIEAMQDKVCALPNVQRCRMLAKGARVAEVHVLADMSKPAKAVVRDIETLVLLEFGLRLDHRTFSVVCFDAPGPVQWIERDGETLVVPKAPGDPGVGLIVVRQGR